MIRKLHWKSTGASLGAPTERWNNRGHGERLGVCFPAQFVASPRRVNPMTAQFRVIVNEVEPAVSFYTEKLGFKVVDQYAGVFAMLEHDGFRLWVSGPKSSAGRPMPDGRVPE